jgi:hypothetical protein
MKHVIVSPFVVDGILKVHVTRINREAGTIESLNTDGSWVIASLYTVDPEAVFSVPQEMTRKLVQDLSA